MSSASDAPGGNDPGPGPGPGDAYQRYLDGDAEAAIAMARSVLDRQREDGDRIGEARTWLFIGLLQYHLGRMGESSACVESALQAFTAAGEQPEIGRCFRWLGRIGVRKGAIVEAEGHFRSSWSTYVDCGDQAAVAAVSVDIGDTRFMRHDEHEAVTWWVRAWKSAESLGIDVLMDELTQRYAIWSDRRRRRR